jgi:hypothetical protein
MKPSRERRFTSKNGAEMLIFKGSRGKTTTPASLFAEN